VTDWPKHHPWPPLGGLRHLTFYSKPNGFRDAFVRVGRRVLVDKGKFFEAARARQLGCNR